MAAAGASRKREEGRREEEVGEGSLERFGGGFQRLSPPTPPSNSPTPPPPPLPSPLQGLSQFGNSWEGGGVEVRGWGGGGGVVDSWELMGTRNKFCWT